MNQHRPRVLQCVSHLALGGAERVALNITTILGEEFTFGVYAVRGLGDGAVGEALHGEVKEYGLPLFRGPRIPMRFGGMITGAIGLARAIRQFRPDLIHLHTEIPEASYASLVTVWPGVAGIPLVRTIHNAHYWEFWRTLGRWCDRRMTDSYCAGVSTDTFAAVQRLRTESGAAPLPVGPRLVYNALPDTPLREPRVWLGGAPFRILFGGRLEEQKGADLLPTILARVQLPAGGRAALTVFGSGRFEAQLRQLGINPPPRWTVEVHPPVPDFASRMADYDLVIMPSRFEGLGLVSLEAIAAGLPLVATQAPGMRESLPPDHPWLATAGDPESFAALLSDALATPERWPDAVRAAQRFAQVRFSIDAMREGYRSLYAAALCHASSQRGPQK